MDRGNADYLIRLRDRELLDQPVEYIPLERLVIDFSPRIDGEDEDYVRTLAETESDLPPILVHRTTMTVVDGVHRLRAAALSGDQRIAVRFFDGDRADALLLSVATNIAQGRPLSAADRTAAAERIFASHPQWSDRAVAAVTGLSTRKVGRLREGTAAAASGHRIGRDGRARPVDSSRGRELAGEIIRNDPGASLRQIAARVGLSPATVADVRDRLRRGENPVPSGRRISAASADSGDGADSGSGAPPLPLPVRIPTARPAPRRTPEAVAPAELLKIFDSLRRDPSLRFSESGRNVLRMLDACALVARDRRKIAATVPSHCKEPMALLAHGYAGVWRMLAGDLEEAETEGLRPAEAGEATSIGA
ncbi:ParB N-terminal domain-containing protein [Streptomyces sp. NPDC051322]|uniref:winged helix-turn-helix transcriptional regulator n=1 Tax=Streptomyces sp. NPDC051322 TaxID=3154645 RepID=UPI00344F33DB